MASSCRCHPKRKPLLLPLPPPHCHLHSNSIITFFYSTLGFSLLILFMLLFQFAVVSAFSPIITSTNSTNSSEFKRTMKAHLRRLNKPSLKTIQSPDGDTIDCVPSHRQPTFDHPLFKGLQPLGEPERPKGHNTSRENHEINMYQLLSFQEWRKSGEECPEGSIPIRRTRKEDVMRADSIARFGMKPVVRRASTSTGHEHAVGYAMGPGQKYYGAKGSMSVCAPEVATSAEFSLSQMWLLSGSFASDSDLNTIEAGWQVSPQLYGDERPRFFTYWTNDAYQTTGCYNLYCAGFVQTNNKIVMGAAISPTSVYDGRQYDITILIWKDPKHGHWWLEFGPGILVGYWPSFLFSHLGTHATMVQFGGEVVNTRPYGAHSWTQMGSGHFSREGAKRAAYFRNLQVVDWDNNLIPLCTPRLVADHPHCYDIRGGSRNEWGNYFYYGGPGRNARCR